MRRTVTVLVSLLAPTGSCRTAPVSPTAPTSPAAATPTPTPRSYVDAKGAPVVNQSIHICEAAVSRGHLVALIGGYDKTRRPALDRLATVAPAAAAGLTRAVPSP